MKERLQQLFRAAIDQLDEAKSGSGGYLMAGLGGFLFPFLIFAVGHAAPGFYNRHILPACHLIILPALPWVWAISAVILLLLLDKGAALVKQILTFILSFTCGLFLIYDWWYFASLTLALTLPFYLWYARRHQWYQGVFSTLLLVGVCVAVTLSALLTDFRMDSRFGVRIGPAAQSAVALTFTVVLAIILAVWAVWFGLRSFGRARATLAYLIERSPRAIEFYDDVLRMSRNRMNEGPANRLEPAFPIEQVNPPGPLWPLTDYFHRPLFLGTNTAICRWLSRLGPASAVGKWLRPALRSPHLDSSLFRNLLKQAIHREGNFYYSSLFSVENEPTSRVITHERIVRLNLKRGSGPAYHILAGETVLGRAEDLENPIPDDLISLHHCTIRLLGDSTVEVEDHSTNGTKLNGVEFIRETRVMNPGDELGLGRVAYVLVARTEKVVDQAETHMNETQLARLVSLDAESWEKRVEKANRHFARYTLLTEAYAEARHYFGLNALDQDFDPASEARRQLLQQGLGGRILLEAPPESSPGEWAQVHEVYERLWIENLNRLFMAGGLAAVETFRPGPESTDRAALQILTRSLLHLRARVAPEEYGRERCAADLGLILALADEGTARDMASYLDGFFLRLIQEIRVNPRRAEEIAWDQVAIAALPYLYWCVADRSWNKGFEIYTRFSKLSDQPWGALGQAQSLAFGALLLTGANYQDNAAHKNDLKAKIADAVAAFKQPILDPLGGACLRLAFLAHALRATPV